MAGPRIGHESHVRIPVQLGLLFALQYLDDAPADRFARLLGRWQEKIPDDACRRYDGGDDDTCPQS